MLLYWVMQTNQTNFWKNAISTFLAWKGQKSKISRRCIFLFIMPKRLSRWKPNWLSDANFCLSISRTKSRITMFLLFANCNCNQSRYPILHLVMIVSHASLQICFFGYPVPTFLVMRCNGYFLASSISLLKNMGIYVNSSLSHGFIFGRILFWRNFMTRPKSTTA